MKRALLFFSLVSLGSWSCSDDPPTPPPVPTLPPITQTGENTFGCYVDGELWLPKGGGMQITLSADYYNSVVYLEASDHQNDQIFHLAFGKIYRDSMFWISNNLSAENFQDFYLRILNQNNVAIADHPAISNSGQCIISRLDTVNRIVSGTFFFDVVDTSSGETREVRDGRFDLRY